MNISHHPTEDIIVAFAAGVLHPLLAVVVDRHIRICAQCESDLALASAIGVALLKRSVDELTSEQIQRTSTRLRRWSRRPGADRAEFSAERLLREADAHLDRCLQQLDGGLSWRRISPKVSDYVVAGGRAPQAWLRLFRFSPGASVPQHTHAGDECTLVLRGSYEDQTGHYAAGDFCSADGDLAHSPKVVGDKPCIALIAATGNLCFVQRRYAAAARVLGI
ncbi:MAG: ChrR family anti-sigma-E factor [Gammaproteobacteria bacterium]|nr:ChrR family anti-sigma-E factor [Gammaproteobacteria bacterium]